MYLMNYRVNDLVVGEVVIQAPPKEVVLHHINLYTVVVGQLVNKKCDIAAARWPREAI